MKKLSKKERKFVDTNENAKNYIAYDELKLYANTDIPLSPSKTGMNETLLTVKDVWADFVPNENIRYETVFDSEKKKTFVIVADNYDDDKLLAETDVYIPSYDSAKAVILINEFDRLPQQSVIDALVKKNCFVFVVDYNGIKPDTHTHFPQEIDYGKIGNEGIHNKEVCPTAKETGQYLYVKILRRCLDFIGLRFPDKEIVAVGIRTGADLAMQLSGTEKKRVSGLACICGAGYSKLIDIPKFGSALWTPDNKTLSWITGVSGISYMKNYPNPVFVGIGTNGTISDIDRTGSLRSLIKGKFTLSVSQQSADNIDAKTFNMFIMWLDGVYWHSSFPEPPVTTIEINNDGTVYADIKATGIPPIKQAYFYYSCDDINHKTRCWKQISGETVGFAQHLAKLTFNSNCEHLFYYTEIVYVNGMTVTEELQYINLKKYRLKITPEKNSSILFRHGGEGHFCEISDDAVIMTDGITEETVPTGAKGSVCKSGSMHIYVASNCKNADSSRILQVDSFCEKQNYTLELIATLRGSNIEYKASKKLVSINTFVDAQFNCTDFKDEYFRPLTEWKDIATITVVNSNIIINKMIFI